MRKFQKILSLLLSLVLLISSIFVGGVFASAATELYTTINTYDDDSDITLTNFTYDNNPAIQVDGDYDYESFGCYGATLTQDPLSEEDNNVIKFTQARVYNDNWPTAIRIYKQGDGNTKTTFEGFTPKTKTTYEYEFRYYVKKAPNTKVNFQIRNTTKRLHGNAEESCYNPDRILVTAGSIASGTTTDDWVTVKGKFTVGSTVNMLGLFVAASSTTKASLEVYVDDIRISECAPITIYNYNGDSEKTVYATEFTTIAELDTVTPDGYILTGIYSDKELTNKINTSELAFNYSANGVYCGYAKLNAGEYYCGFENYKTITNSNSFDSATTAIVSGDTYAGGYNIKLNASENSLTAFELRDDKAFETKAGTEYVISFQYRSSAAAKLYAGTAQASEVPTTATAINGAELPVAEDWTAASITVTLDKGQKEGFVPVLIVSSTVAATIEFDNVYMTYPVEETQNIEDKFIVSEDWYPSLALFDRITIPEASAVWNGGVEVPTDANGDGVYEVDTAEKLAYVVKNGGTVTLDDTTVVENGNFILTKDIYLNDISAYNWLSDKDSSSLKAWYTSDDVTAWFNGTLDGNFHTIYGLYSRYKYSCWHANDGGRGLIPKVNGGQTATVKNLTIDCANIDAECNGGAIIGNNYGGTVVIDSCVVGENVYITGYRAGAIVGGGIDQTNTITNCASFATTELEVMTDTSTGDYSSVGLVPYYHITKTTISNCFNANGPITSGSNGAIKVYNSFATEAGGVTAGITVLTKEQMQGKNVLNINGTMPILNSNGNYWLATEGYPVLSASRGIEVKDLGIWDGTRVAPIDSDGDGIIEINTAEEFAYAIYNGGGADKTYKLTANIFLNNVDLINWETGETAAGYTPNSWYKNRTFQGTLDGDGYSVYGLYYDDGKANADKSTNITTNRNNYVGLIPGVDSGKTLNLNKIGVDYMYINYYAAASPFVGRAGNNGTTAVVRFNQCYSGENVYVTAGYAAAAVGYGVCSTIYADNVASNAHIYSKSVSFDPEQSRFIPNDWALTHGGYYNSYNSVGAIALGGWSVIDKVSARNYKAGYGISGGEVVNWFASTRTVENMKGLDALTSSSKMPNLNKDADGNNTGIFTATESFPILTVMVGKMYEKPESTEDIITENGEMSYEYWDGTSTAPVLGSGTEDDPWQITNGAELYYVIKNGGGEGVYYELQNDIYLNDLTKINWQTGSIAANYTLQLWTYGKSVTFKGNLDGNGYVVHGLYIHDEKISYTSGDTGYAALIPNIDGTASVKNLGLDNSFIRYTVVAGGLVGCVSTENGNAEIVNCYVGKNVSIDASFVGGILGRVVSGASVIIDRCYSLADNNKNNTSADIIGDLFYDKKPNNITISNTYCLGKILRNTNVIGTVAVTNCYEGINGAWNTGVTTLTAENMQGKDAIVSASKMAGLNAASAYITQKADFARANANVYVYLPAGTILEEDFAPLFFDTRMAPLSSDSVMFTDRMICGAYVKFTEKVDVNKIHVPVSKAHRVAFGTAQELLASGYYDIETQIISENLSGQPNDTVNYLFITDPHFNAKWGTVYWQSSKAQFALAIKMANEMDDIEFVCLGGDLTSGEYSTSDECMDEVSEYLAPIKDCTKPVFVLNGNHDDNAYGTFSADKVVSPEQWQEGVIEQFVNRELADGTKIKVVQDTDPYNSEMVNSKYYYYDLETKNTRVICLNASDFPYEYDENGNFTLVVKDETASGYEKYYNGRDFWGYSQYQLKWLAEEALGALPEDYNVIILSHMAILGETKVTYTNGTVLADIMSAYQSKMVYANDTYNISADYCDDTGRIMAYQYGHVHAPNAVYEYGAQVWRIASSTTNAYSGGLDNRIFNEKAGAIDVMSVSEGYIYKQSIGHGTTAFYINDFVVQEGDITVDGTVDICDLVKLNNLNNANMPSVLAADFDIAKMRKLLLGMS